MLSCCNISNCCVISNNRAVLDFIIVVVIANGFNTPKIINRWSHNSLSNTVSCKDSLSFESCNTVPRLLTQEA